MHTHGLMPVVILAVGIAAQWLAWRTRLPAIVLLAASGLLIGPVFGFVPSGPDVSELIQPIVSLCVAIILFEGGLSLQRTELRVASVGVGRLVYVGGPLAWLLGTLAAHYIGGLSWYVATVFGAIMVVGMNTLVRAGDDLMEPRNLALVAIIVIFGVGGMSLPLGSEARLGGIGLAGITGVILNLILPRSK